MLICLNNEARCCNRFFTTSAGFHLHFGTVTRFFCFSKFFKTEKKIPEAFSVNTAFLDLLDWQGFTGLQANVWPIEVSDNRLHSAETRLQDLFYFK